MHSTKQDSKNKQKCANNHNKYKVAKISWQKTKTFRVYYFFK